jgi:hypothetical protein
LGKWESRVRKYRNRLGKDNIHCRTGTCEETTSTRWAAVSSIRRVLQEGLIPRPFQEKAMRKSYPTPGTSCSGKAMRQDTILEIFAEILLDVSGNRGTFLICLTTTGQPDFQMTLNDLISRFALRLPTSINLSGWNAFRHSWVKGLRSHNAIWE